ncbi:MAG TPA: hypothetical protein VKQ36_06475 [Ktedonobacterales bacterium]|nr:hypothetical protein [Ktedonobacterales bacterium]
METVSLDVNVEPQVPNSLPVLYVLRKRQGAIDAIKEYERRQRQSA